MNVIKTITALCFICLLFSCDEEAKKLTFAVDEEVQKFTEPFRFHKAIEVKSGLTFDIVSWGRGSDSLGGYLILRSDSTNLSYRSVSGELKGKVVDAWNMDLDTDGSPEVYIQATLAGNDSLLNMYVHEFGDNGSSQQIRFPDLNASLKEGYSGGDSLYINNGKLIREFPFFSSKDSASAAKPKSRKLEYILKNNSLQFKEIKEEAEAKKP